MLVFVKIDIERYTDSTTDFKIPYERDFLLSFLFSLFFIGLSMGVGGACRHTMQERDNWFYFRAVTRTNLLWELKKSFEQVELTLAFKKIKVCVVCCCSREETGTEEGLRFLDHRWWR
jgi:hypothetical protein